MQKKKKTCVQECMATVYEWMLSGLWQCSLHLCVVSFSVVFASFSHTVHSVFPFTKAFRQWNEQKCVKMERKRTQTGRCKRAEESTTATVTHST